MAGRAGVIASAAIVGQRWGMSQSDPAAPLQGLQELEGFEPRPTIEEPSAYPLEDVMVRSETRTVVEVVKRINTDRYIMDPDFQRDFIWPPEKQSKLIESCVMRIPLPVFYVAEALDGRVAVVDGLQRLSTFRRFLSDELTLTGLGESHPLNGKIFTDLPIHLQERIEDTQLTLYILDKDAPEVARLDIFERVNGGEPLTRQQMRNAIYNGEGTRWLTRMAATSEFREATDGRFDWHTMRDREAINRFAAFRLLDWQTYENGDMDDFLARALRQMNQSTAAESAKLEREFIRSMTTNCRLFGRHAFRKSLRERTASADRTRLNIALFDVFSVALVPITSQIIEQHDEELVAKLAVLLRNPEFDQSISQSTNSTNKVHTKFAMADAVLKSVLS